MNFAIQPVIAVQDATGVTVTTSTAPVSLIITTGSGTAGALVVGTTMVNAVNGIATFSGLSINKAGMGYTLTATSGTLTPAISQVFKIVHPGDADEDGMVSMGDVVKIERIILGLDPPTSGCDADGDGKVSMGDAVKIERIILGLDPLAG